MNGLSDADREYLEKSCAASGVPVLITDPVVIARAAGLLRETESPLSLSANHANGMGTERAILGPQRTPSGGC